MDYRKLQAIPQKMAGFIANHKFAWLGVVAALPLFGVVTTVAVAADEKSAAEQPLPTVQQISERLALPAFTSTTPDTTRYWREAQIQRGETLGHLLNRLGIGDADARRFLYSGSVPADVLKLRAGATLSVQTNDKGELFTLRFLNDDENGEQILVVLENRGGVWQASTDPLPTETIATVRSVEIKGSAYGALAQAGVPSEVRAQLSDIFSDSFDFKSLKRGDRVNLVYQTMYYEGMPISSGNIDAVEIVKGGERHSAFYHAFDSETGAYFDENGKPLKKGFSLQAVKGARVSSGYGFRFHPILKRMRMHKGIDYAAPTGTPIYAPADGRVASASRDSGYGNVVRLAHSKGITTLYAHMSRFAPGMKSGKTVKAGEVIGYVGSTGRSTGPHLHMEVRVGGDTVNPVTVAMPARELTRAEKGKFAANQKLLETRLALLRALPVNVAQLD